MICCVIRIYESILDPDCRRLYGKQEVRHLETCAPEDRHKTPAFVLQSDLADVLELHQPIEETLAEVEKKLIRLAWPYIHPALHQSKGQGEVEVGVAYE